MAGRAEMTDSHEIALEENERGGRWVMRMEGVEPRDWPEMTFRRTGARTILIDHTGVPPRLEGRGLGSALVKRGVADARARGWRIVPACPFVAVAFRRHPEWSDLLADGSYSRTVPRAAP